MTSCRQLIGGSIRVLTLGGGVIEAARIPRLMVGQGRPGKGWLLAVLVVGFVMSGLGHLGIATVSADEGGSDGSDPIVATSLNITRTPKSWALMKDSHEHFLAVDAHWVKVDPGDRDTYNRTVEAGVDGTLPMKIWTIGEEVTIHIPGHPAIPEGTTIHTRRTTSGELEDIGLIAATAHSARSYPSVTVRVQSIDQINQIAALPFVYMVEFYGDYRTFASAYEPDWIKDMEQIDLLQANRDQYDGDGSGEMPSSTSFHVLDTGYDTRETLFSVPHAELNIDHQHDWVDDNCGDLGCDVSVGDNTHGTLVADILDLMNLDGGRIIIHKVGEGSSLDPVAIERALDHMAQEKFTFIAAHAATMSIGRLTGFTCVNDFDEYLSDLSQSGYSTMIASALPNPDVQNSMSYPASSTFTFGVRGAENANPWTTPNDGNWGEVLLSSTDCPEQWQFHQDTDGGLAVYKPDVYGFFVVTTDVGGNREGTSLATPQVASGLGTIQSRAHVAKDDSLWFWKEWDSNDNCWEGAFRLVARSAAPDGRDVEPDGVNTDPSRFGDLADHNAWFMDSDACDASSDNLQIT